ncbi:leucine-rich repeat protein [Demequina aurantiaca]|uniref:leucine-rich repeat protein n=1 Tax=Demequina aurantiaca TaxID=676200 RepID=UPI003D3400C9
MKTVTARIAATAIVALITGAVTALPASAATASITVDGITYTVDDANVSAGAEVTEYDPGVGGTSPEIDPTVTIGPNTYDVVSIGASAFGANGLTSVTIPNSVTTIGYQSFRYNDLESVTIPDSVTTIEALAFAHNSLASLTIPNSVTTIGGQAFWDNLLQEVSIPDTVTTIGGYVFSENDLTSVTIPDSFTSISGGLFWRNNLESVTIPNGVTSIGETAFAENSLAHVTIPNGVTSIGEGAFWGNSLTSVAIPASVTFIDVVAFFENPLTSVAFEGNAPVMGAAPFGDVGLTNDPLVSYFARNAGFTAPTWTAGETEYRSQALATVTFDANGHGTTPAAVDVVVDDTVSEPADPTETGYTFDGWFDAATDGNAFAFATPITEDLTLFAQWSEVVPEPTATPAPSPSSTAEVDTEVAVAAGEELADTGATNTGLIWIAGLFLALGAAALALRARRTH